MAGRGRLLKRWRAFEGVVLRALCVSKSFSRWRERLLQASAVRAIV